MQKNTPYQFSRFKIRTLSDQRFLIGWTITSLIVSFLLTTTVAAKTYLEQFVNIRAVFGRHDGGWIKAPTVPPWEVFNSDKLTFILLGYDEVDRFAHRSDTLMVGAVDFYAKSVKIISIPRDMLVRIPRHGIDKANAAYAIGGEALVRSTVEEFIRVPIDYVVAVNYKGFIEVVDALGGVEIKVEQPMHYDDRRGKVHIHFKPGIYHMNGKDALNYVRYRHDALGDLGRIQRQQAFLEALFQQAIKPGNWVNIQKAANAFLDNIKVVRNPESPRRVPEITLTQVFSLAGFLSTLNQDQIRFYQMPGDVIMWRRLSCIRPHYDKAKKILLEVFDDEALPGWEKLDIENVEENKDENEKSENAQPME